MIDRDDAQGHADLASRQIIPKEAEVAVQRPG